MITKKTDEIVSTAFRTNVHHPSCYWMLQLNHLKLTKSPCAVSGLRYPTEVPSGPMVVLNIRLNGNGWVMLFSGLLGDFTEYFFSMSCSSTAENASACR